FFVPLPLWLVFFAGVKQPLRQNLCADAFVGKDLQEKGVAESAVEDVNLADAGGEAIETGLSFGQHAGVDNSVSDELATTVNVQTGNASPSIVTIAEDARRIGQENEFVGFQSGGDGGGSRVCVHVEPTAVLIFRQRGHYGDNFARGHVLDQFRIDSRHMTDV